MSRTCVSLARVPISRARLGQYRHTGRGVALCLSDGEVERRFRAWRGGTGAPPPFGTAGAAARRSGDPAQAPIAPQTAIAFQTVARPAPFHPSIRPAHPPPTTVAHNGYRYRIDGTGRTMAVTGALMLDPDQPRSRTAQAAAGGADRRAPTTAAIISPPASAARARPTIISRRTRSSTAAPIACSRTDGQRRHEAATASSSISAPIMSAHASAPSRSASCAASTARSTATFSPTHPSAPPAAPAARPAARDRARPPTNSISVSKSLGWRAEPVARYRRPITGAAAWT